ncbi:MAG TPA: sigma-70 family RNA polymerase sigma factor, partial [Gemmataceae bacterium]
FDAHRHYLVALGRDVVPPDLHRKGSVSDLVQDTFIAAQRTFDRFTGDSAAEVRAWLRQIFLRNAAGFRRDYTSRQKRRLDREVSLDGGRSGDRVKENLTANDPPPDAEAVRREQTNLLRDAVGGLPENYRRAFLLHHRDQLSYEAIGRDLGCSPEAARKYCTRALRMVAAIVHPST